MHTRVATILTFVAVLLPVAGHASCPCLPRALAEKYGAANAVFLGRLSTVREIPESEPRTARLRFSVVQSWKGTGLPEQEVTIPVSLDTCGLPEERVGTEYLVFARAAEGSGELQTSICDGTDAADALPGDLRELRMLYQPVTIDERHRFPDVPSDHPYAQAINDLYTDRVIAGYPDGMLRPSWPLTRAEAAKIVTLATQAYHREDPVEAYARRDAPFHDVDKSAWYYPWLLRSLKAGYIRGFADGTFRPEQRVTVAEAASMVARAMDLPLPPATGLWYEAPLRAIAGREALPPSITRQADVITRGELIEMLWRLTRHVVNHESAAVADILADHCEPAIDPSIAGVDLVRLRAAWLTLFNAERRKKGLPPYIASATLDRTAAAWSLASAAKGAIDHRRDPSDAYYDYKNIEAWFRDRGVTFQNIGGKTFTESIGWGTYRCDVSDCTDTLINAIRSTFDFFLSEESRAVRPHYQAIVEPAFTALGMGVAVRDGRYYITTHIATRATQDITQLCHAR